jgi:hypothetical protein
LEDWVNVIYAIRQNKTIPRKKTRGKDFFSNVIGKLLKFNFTIIEYILLIILGAVYFNGGKCFQKYIKITRENLFHTYSVRGKLFETGIVPVALEKNPFHKLL